MNKDLKTALDNELKKERNRRWGIWLFIVLAFVLVLAVFTPVFSEQIVGETTEVTIKDRSDISKVQLKVKLDTGEVITVLADSALDHFAGRKVAISKMTSLAGMKTYQFMRHAKPGS